MDVEATTDEPARAPTRTRSSSACSRTRTSPTTLPGGALGALLESGEARRAFKRLAVTHAEGRRFVLVGLGAARRVRRRAGPRRGRRRARTRPRARRAHAVLGGPPPRRRRWSSAGSSRARCCTPTGSTATSDCTGSEASARSSGCWSAPITTSRRRSAAASVVAAAQNRARDLRTRRPTTSRRTALAAYASQTAGAARARVGRR